MQLNKPNVIAICCLVIVVGVCMHWIDRPVAEYFKLLDLTAPQLIKPFKTITDAGKSQWFLLPLAAFCIFSLAMMRIRQDRKKLWADRLSKAAFTFSSLAVSGLLTDAIKILVGRPRPTLLAQDIYNQFAPFTFDAKWWSFPSGHSTTVMALALAVGMIAPRWRWPFLLFAGVIISSRIIVAAHYPADAIGGIAVAILVHGALLHIFIRRRWASWDIPTKGRN